MKSNNLGSNLIVGSNLGRYYLSDLIFNLQDHILNGLNLIFKNTKMLT